MTICNIIVVEAQSYDFKQIVSHIEAGHIEEAKRELILLESDSPDSLRSELYYLNGVIDEALGDLYNSNLNFEKCIELSENRALLSDTYLDALARCANIASAAKDWPEVVRLTRKALACPDTLLETYPNTYMFYEWQIHALNSLWKYQDVVTLAEKGKPLWEKQFSPTQREFYNIRIGQIVALLLMNRWDEAERKINEIETINATQGNGIIDHEVSSLRKRLTESKSTIDWRDDPNMKIRTVYEMANNLLLSSPCSAEGYYNWTKFFSYIQKQLELYYFDINDPEDERFWSQLLACAIVYFNTICEDMPNHSELAYDLILLRKNFLDYHSGQLHKSPKRWQEIRDRLMADELAIEITMCPDEILVLGKEYQSPIAIPIPEDIMTGIELYNSSDVVTINDFHSAGSPLTSLVQLIEPYCSNINTIFLSPTNLFAQFNFSAIPYGDGILDDRFNIIQLTTTADIENYRSTATVDIPKTAILFGGIDYDSTPNEASELAYNGHNEIAKHISEIRTGYGYLPYTLNEVERIAELIPNSSLLTGRLASETQFKKTDWAKKRSIVHLATHGYTIPATRNVEHSDSASWITSLRLKSGFLMSGANQSLKGISSGCDDGILTSQEIAELDMSGVNLGVLSSCSSGMGDLSNTTGIVYGVANAMKSAGVNHLVVTLWDIPDEATYIGMKNFYENIMSGLSVRASIKEMRKHLINNGYIDPYYWGAFVAID